jgi:hypothetical protein
MNASRPRAWSLPLASENVTSSEEVLPAGILSSNAVVEAFNYVSRFHSVLQRIDVLVDCDRRTSESGLG